MQFIKFITTEIFIKSNIYIYLVGIGVYTLYLHRYWYKLHFLFFTYLRVNSNVFNNCNQFNHPPKNWTKTSIRLIYITIASKAQLYR